MVNYKCYYSKKKSAEIKLSQLNDCQEFVEMSLKIGNPQQVLTSAKEMMEHLSHVTQQVNIEESNPRLFTIIHFNRDSNINNTLHHIGNIVCTSFTSLQKCKVKKIDRHDITITDNAVSFPLSIQFSDSSLLTVPLSLLSCSVVPVSTTIPIKTTITTTTHPGVYTIHCSPVTRGRYQVNVEVSDIQIESTSLVIPFNPYHDNITSIRTIPGFNRPYGVAVTNDGHVIVNEFSSKCVTVLDKEGKKVKSFGKGNGNIKFSIPSGVVVTPDNFILVVDNHKIQKISIDGEYITSVGKEGSGPVEFDHAYGIGISSTTGHIYC